LPYTGVRRELTVFRGGNLTRKELDSYKLSIGHSIEWSPLTSSTMNRHLAENCGGYPGNTLFIIHRERASRTCKDISSVSHYRADLRTHIICDQHQMDVDYNKKQSSNDAARIHLMETLKTVNTISQIQTTAIFEQQSPTAKSTTTSKFRTDKYINHFNSEGWGLRVRKSGQRISQDVKSFIENIWKDGMQNGRKIQADAIRQRIRSERNDKKEKLFTPDRYVSAAQIKYQIKKLNKKYDVSIEQQLISDLLLQTTTS
ncbi:unnamed protein product, partial [Didymodactylos carnosus]